MSNRFEPPNEIHNDIIYDKLYDLKQMDEKQVEETSHRKYTNVVNNRRQYLVYFFDPSGLKRVWITDNNIEGNLMLYNPTNAMDMIDPKLSSLKNKKVYNIYMYIYLYMCIYMSIYN